MPATDRDVIIEAIRTLEAALKGDANAMKGLRRAFAGLAERRARSRAVEGEARTRILRRIRVESAVRRWEPVARDAKKHFESICKAGKGPSPAQIVHYREQNPDFDAMCTAIVPRPTPGMLLKLINKPGVPSEFVIDAVALKHGISGSLLKHDRTDRGRLMKQQGTKILLASLKSLERSRRWKSARRRSE